METFKLYTISIKGFKDNIKGIVLKDSEEWVMLKGLFTDYMLDGIYFINKKYILLANRGKNEIFTEEVLKASGKWNFIYDENIPLSTDLLFPWLKDTQQVFQFFQRDDLACYIGKIQRLLQKTFYLKYINPEGIWEEEMLFHISPIKCIEIDTDYVSSLLAYNGKNKKNNDYYEH